MSTTKAPLTAAEIANIWTQYINDSMALQVNTYLREKTKDPEVQNILERAINMSQSHLAATKTFFEEENYPVPVGFNERDINLQAPPLFSEDLTLVYLQVMALHGLNSYSFCLTASCRQDQRNYFTACLQNSGDLYDHIIKTMLEKGIYSKPPSLHPPHSVKFVSNDHYLAGWWGKKRPLNGIEISGLHYNMQKTIVKVVLEVGFSQVAQSEELRKYFQKGLKICKKQYSQMGKMLTQELLPTPRRWESEVTDSTIAPFSDKLMLFHIVSLISVSVGYYGTALSHCQRRDLALMYTKTIGEIGLFGEEGAKLLIKNNWMEQPPLSDDREALARIKRRSERG